MPEETKDVKPVGDSSNTGVDENGVPWQNRAKENERKLQEALTRVNDLESKLSKSADPKEAQAEINEKLVAFTRDPDAYIERKHQESEYKRQISDVVPWLEKQQGFTQEDKTRLVAIEKEHGLNGMPLDVAKSAWRIRQAEKFEQELSKLKSETTRDTRLSETRTEGTGKTSSDGSTKLTRADILKKMSETENWNDYAKYVDQLEDTR